MKINYAYIETTTYCNLACKFCNRTDVIDGLTHMSVDEFSRVLSQLSSHPITEAKLMGMGEPFMHPQFDQICKQFKETFPSCYVISATNGQIKLTRMFERALSNLDICYISIDGAKENYERIRVGSSWEKLLKFLSKLSSVKSSVKCQFPINYTVCPDNVFDIPVMFDLINEFGLDDLRLNFVQNWSEGEKDNALNGFTVEQLEFLKQYKQWFKGKPVWDYSDCFWVKNGCYITATGKMKVCCMNTSADTIGNILLQPLQIIHSSPAFNSIRTGCENNSPTAHCANCSYKELVPFLRMINEV